MIIERIDVDGFRNIRDSLIFPDPGLNILYGDNGAGKTNLLEALWIMTGVKSFRGAREQELFGYDRTAMTICINFMDKDRRQVITALYDKKKLHSITANGVAITPRLSQFFGMVKAVIFTPEDLSLVNGEPILRRSFCNLSVSQIRPAYAGVITRYNRVLAQRNACLKDPTCNIDTEIWDAQLSKLGAHISLYRDVYIKMLDRAAGQIYNEISSGKEKLSVRFYSSVYKKIIEAAEFTPEYYYERLCEHADDERRIGTTLVGIHRDDIFLTLDNKPVREFASQGQQRSVALALKLAAAKILEVETNEPPIVLLDDVLSELDASRRRYILDNLSGYQTIITACEKIEGGKLFLVKNGEIDEDPPRGGRPRYPK